MSDAIDYGNLAAIRGRWNSVKSLDDGGIEGQMIIDCGVLLELYDTERTARLSAEKRVVELETEIDRVAGFLMEHGFPGYSFKTPGPSHADGRVNHE